MEILRDRLTFTQMDAAFHWGEIGPGAKAPITPLLQALKDSPYVQVRHLAAEARGQSGPDATEAIAALTEAIKDTEQVYGFCTASAAAKAIKQIVPVSPKKPIRGNRR